MTISAKPSFTFSGAYVPAFNAPEWIRAFPWAIANRVGVDYDINPKLLAAVAQTESSGNTWAMRFEPTWLYFYFIADNAQRCGITKDTERAAQATSWGLMQVMGSVARELGFRGSLAQLCDPEIGLRLGVEKLAKCRAQQGGDMDCGLLAYNAGTIRRDGAGKPANQIYLDKVKANLATVLRS